MRNAYKKFSIMLLAAVIFITSVCPVVLVSAENSIKLNCSISNYNVRPGEEVTVTFYLDGFQNSGVKISEIEFEAAINNVLFEFVSCKCLLNSTNTEVCCTSYEKDSRHVNTKYKAKDGCYLSENSRNVASVTLMLNHDYADSTKIYEMYIPAFKVTLSENGTLTEYDGGIVTPVINMVGSMVELPTPTATPKVTNAPTAKPTSESTSKTEENTTPAPGEDGEGEQTSSPTGGQPSDDGQDAYKIIIDINGNSFENKAQYDEAVTVSLTDGEISGNLEFTCWKKTVNGQTSIVSYNDNYSFLAVCDADIEAVFGGEDNSNAPVIAAFTLQDGNLLVERNVPSVFTYISTEITITYGEGEKKIAIEGSSPNAQFILDCNDISPEKAEIVLNYIENGETKSIVSSVDF